MNIHMLLPALFVFALISCKEVNVSTKKQNVTSLLNILLINADDQANKDIPSFPHSQRDVNTPNIENGELKFASCDDSGSRIDLSEHIGKHKVVFIKPPQKIPSSSSIDAPMLGNGYTGVAISGPSEKQVYYLARNDFWRLISSHCKSYPGVIGKIEIEFPSLKTASYH